MVVYRDVNHAGGTSMFFEPLIFVGRHLPYRATVLCGLVRFHLFDDPHFMYIYTYSIGQTTVLRFSSFHFSFHSNKYIPIIRRFRGWSLPKIFLYKFLIMEFQILKSASSSKVGSEKVIFLEIMWYYCMTMVPEYRVLVSLRNRVPIPRP